MPLQHITRKNAEIFTKVVGYVRNPCDYENIDALNIDDCISITNKKEPNEIFIHGLRFYKIFTGRIIDNSSNSALIRIDQTDELWNCRFNDTKQLGADEDAGFLMGNFVEPTIYHKCPKCHKKRSTISGAFCKKCDNRTII